MSRRPLASSIAITVVAVAVVLSGRPALAGPPLLCHPFDIGTARSLPWDGAGGWFQGRTDYDVAHLQADTEALLTPSTPIVVRMETLRRAAIYASRDGQVASRLFALLTGRASQQSGKPDALALLDAAYLTEAFREITSLNDHPQFRGRAPMLRALVGDSDGYALVTQALTARPDDPALEFAAALIAADKDRAAYLRHAEKARAGASRDALVARNIGHIS